MRTYHVTRTIPIPVRSEPGPDGARHRIPKRYTLAPVVVDVGEALSGAEAARIADGVVTDTKVRLWSYRWPAPWRPEQTGFIEVPYHGEPHELKVGGTL